MNVEPPCRVLVTKNREPNPQANDATGQNESKISEIRANPVEWDAATKFRRVPEAIRFRNNLQGNQPAQPVRHRQHQAGDLRNNQDRVNKTFII